MILRRAALIVVKDRVHFPHSFGAAYTVLRSEARDGRWLLEVKRGRFPIEMIVQSDDMIQMADWTSPNPLPDDGEERKVHQVRCFQFPQSGAALCGRIEEWAFTGPSQALDSVLKGAKLTVCPECIDAFNVFVRKQPAG